MSALDSAGFSIASAGEAGPELWASSTGKAISGSSPMARSCGTRAFPIARPCRPRCAAITAASASIRTAIAARPSGPGLVLGLDRGGTCKGIAYRVPAIDVPAALGYLWDREMQSRVYCLKELELQPALRAAPRASPSLSTAATQLCRLHHPDRDGAPHPPGRRPPRHRAAISREHGARARAAGRGRSLAAAARARGAGARRAGARGRLRPPIP